MTPPDAALASLRANFGKLGVDGVLVPRADEHLGEYVAPSAERLAFLSGFTGSAGLAIVTADRAALFTDGRYMIQVVDETGPSWEHHHVHAYPPVRWLDALGGKLRLGYDPMLTGPSLLDDLRGAWGSLVPLAANPVDAIWRARPAPPSGMLRIHADALAGRSGADKRAEIGRALALQGDDAVILSDPASVCWLFNIRGDDLATTPFVLAHALLHADGRAVLFVDAGRVDGATRAHLGADVTVAEPGALDAAIAALAGLRVQLDPARTAAWFNDAVVRHGATPVPSPDPCLLPRACKNAAECRAIRRAHVDDGAALCRFLRWIDAEGVGRTEFEVAERLLAFRLETGTCLGASFDSISAAGANAAIMHYHPTEAGAARLQEGALYLIDSGGQYPGCTTDVTRTVRLGGATPPPDAWRDQFTRVLQGLIALSVAAFPDGTSGHRLDGLARLALWQAGLDFDHGAGHGLGSFLSVHEWPFAFTPRPSSDPVRIGMVLTNEPGFYLPGSHGMRLENAMEVVALGDGALGDGAGGFARFETLTLAPFDRGMIDASLLSAGERAWVDAYHARVLGTLAGRVDADTATWLEEACRPL